MDDIRISCIDDRILFSAEEIQDSGSGDAIIRDDVFCDIADLENRPVLSGDRGKRDSDCLYRAYDGDGDTGAVQEAAGEDRSSAYRCDGGRRNDIREHYDDHASQDIRDELF